MHNDKQDFFFFILKQNILTIPPYTDFDVVSALYIIAKWCEHKHTQSFG